MPPSVHESRSAGTHPVARGSGTVKRGLRDMDGGRPRPVRRRKDDSRGARWYQALMIDRPSRRLHQDVHREYRRDGLTLAVQTGLGSWAGAWDALVDMAPWEPLPRDPNVYFAHRSANFRANLRKAARRLTNEGAYHRAASPSSFDSALEALRGLHAARWGKATPFLLAFDRFAVAAHSGAAQGQVVLHEFVVEETVLASVVGFDVAGRLSLYQSGHATDPRWRN